MRTSYEDLTSKLLVEYGSQWAWEYDLYGKPFIRDFRPTAGESANESGKLFEEVVHFSIKSLDIPQTSQPRFKCHFGLTRRGDFEVDLKGRVVHIECKQLGNAESHFDKLSHCLMNLVHGCYGKEFWLVYDYNKNIKRSGMRKIKALQERCITIKQMCQLQGITFELYTHEEMFAALEDTKNGTVR